MHGFLQPLIRCCKSAVSVAVGFYDKQRMRESLDGVGHFFEQKLGFCCAHIAIKELFAGGEQRIDDWPWPRSRLCRCQQGIQNLVRRKGALHLDL